MFSPELMIVAVIAVLIAGVSKGGFGGGLGMLAVPIIALVETPVIAAALLLPVLCFMDLVGLWFYRGKGDIRLLLLLVPAAVLGIIVGTFSFSYIDPMVLKLGIGMIAVGFALYHWFGRFLLKSANRPASENTTKGFFWGGVAGFTSFVAHAGGPPLSIYLLPMKLDRTVYQGTSVVFFIIVNYIKLIPYFFLGLLNFSNLEVSVALLPVAFLSMLLGVYLHKKVSDQFFYRLCYIVLALIGVKLIYDALASGLLTS